MEDAELRSGLLAGLEYSHQHEEWVTPLEEALAGLTAHEALRRPPGVEKSVWDIVLHLAAWNEDIVVRIETGERHHPPDGAWPAPAPEGGEESWKAAQGRLWASLDSLKRTLETVPMAKVSASPYGLPDLLCRFTHLGYHIGQITKLREWLAAS